MNVFTPDGIFGRRDDMRHETVTVIVELGRVPGQVFRQGVVLPSAALSFIAIGATPAVVQVEHLGRGARRHAQG